MEGGVEVDGCREEVFTRSIQTLKGSQINRGQKSTIVICLACEAPEKQKFPPGTASGAMPASSIGAS
jgi:hypothetical protein